MDIYAAALILQKRTMTTSTIMRWQTIFEYLVTVLSNKSIRILFNGNYPSNSGRFRK